MYSKETEPGEAAEGGEYGGGPVLPHKRKTAVRGMLPRDMWKDEEKQIISSTEI